MTDKYVDILYLQRPVSKKHLPMTMTNRAAQFAPFAALTGHGAAIQETARITSNRKELDEDRKDEIKMKLDILSKTPIGESELKITYFKEDSKKEGGSYETIYEKIQGINYYRRNIILEGEKIIPFDTIIDLDGLVFSKLE